MHYTCEIDINRPRAQTVALFDDPDNLPKWQEGLIAMDHISGEYAQPGSQYRIKFQMGKRQIEMVETLEEHALPDRLVALYETKGVWNRNANIFTDIDGGTRWRMECEFRCTGFMRVLSFLMPGMFRKQTQKMMQSFKSFAESSAT